LTADAAGLTKLTNRSVNANGTYSIVTAGTATGLVIQGEGTENADGTNKVTMQIHVFSDKSDSIVIVH